MAGQDCFDLIDGNVDSVPSDLCLCCSRGSSSGAGLNLTVPDLWFSVT